MKQTKEEALAKASKTLLLAQPFYGVFMLMLNKHWTERIPTLAIGLQGINYKLLVNEEFFMTRTKPVRVGALQHELLHIIHYHLTEFKDLSKIDQEIANIAMDIEINQYIKDENREDSWMMPSTFPDLNLEEKKGTRYYFKKLLEQKQKQNIDLQAIADALAAGESEVTLPSTGKAVQIDIHDWSEIEDLDEATQRIVQRQTEHIVSEVAEQIKRSYGTVPGEIAEMLKALEKLEKPKFNWRGYIRRFIGRSSKIYTKLSRMKPSKRFPGAAGLRFKRRKHVLVAWDTSGSVSSSELVESQKEMAHIQRTGTEVTMIQADTVVTDIGKFDPKKEIKVKGRGGTNFQPVIDYYAAHLKEYSCLIYFTDGEAPAPKDPRGNILWALTGDSDMNKDLPGTVIKLNT